VPGMMNHSGIASGCATCHNGQAFAGVTPVTKAANHLPTSMACETCHAATKFTAFSGTTMNHAGIVANCATCHNGQAFQGVTPLGKLAGHVVTTADCSTCHTSTSTFKAVNGGTTTKPANHLPTTQACSLCHSATNFVPGVMNHTGIARGCATCHNGQAFAGVTPVTKAGNHLPATMACETCHSASKFTSFSGTTMSHTGIASGCTSCHNGQSFQGVTPMRKPANHVPTAGAAGSWPNCETCHTSTASGGFGIGSRILHGHVTVAPGSCASCHERGMSWASTESITTRPSGHTGTRAAPNSCDNRGCHTVNGGF